MLIVHGKAVFGEAISNELRAKLGELAKAVRERHPGNIDYRFSIDAEDGCVLRLTERWDKLESFESHGKTPEVADIGKLLGSLNPTIDLKRYEVSSETSF
jgi:quinol monooxygenase YgiN